ncbi:MAG: hypothetical protein O7F11_00905 [Acidobacteria bacterium]|nr:hypothetical protein [Acidobacteriota bacterium]MCZ6649239.1 hypothetical protein [Acidobacteriota bacterium]MCZ6832281.1 hypothetical protein [Acidobacteriota bacterium]
MNDHQREKMIQGVLARTTGSPCGRARELICTQADDTLEKVDTSLLDGHTAHCAPCRSLATVMAWLPQPLLELAEVDPGEAFTAATLKVMLPWRQRVARRLRNLGEEWTSLMRRPRFAWEAAYIGAAIIGLLFAAPVSPLRDVPGEALRVAQANPVQALVEVSRRQLPVTMVNWGDAAWAATGGRAGTTARIWRDDLWDRLDRAWEAGAPLGSDTAELGSALWARQGDRIRNAIGRIKIDFHDIRTELATTSSRNNSHKQLDSSGERDER